MEVEAPSPLPRGRVEGLVTSFIHPVVARPKERADGSLSIISAAIGSRPANPQTMRLCDPSVPDFLHSRQHSSSP